MGLLLYKNSASHNFAMSALYYQEITQIIKSRMSLLMSLYILKV